MEQITIQGQSFGVPLKYEEGHELTSGEASALNQTFHENIRNNVAAKIKKGENVDQSYVDSYASTYVFGVRAGGGSGVTRDPIMSRALVIARNKVKEAIRVAIATPGHKYFGQKIGNFTAEAINTAAKNKIAADPNVLELAKQQIEDERSAASTDLNLDDLALKE